MSFNMRQFLQKRAFYEGAQGYMLGQTRAWMNCNKARLDKGSSPNDAWQGCIDEYQKAGGNMTWAKKYASDVVDELEKHGQAVGGDYQLQMGSYWDAIDKKIKAGKDAGEAVMDTLEECEQEAGKIPPK